MFRYILEIARFLPHGKLISRTLLIMLVLLVKVPRLRPNGHDRCAGMVHGMATGTLILAPYDIVEWSIALTVAD